MSDRASRGGPVVVLVPVPFEGGSPKTARDIKPPRYPQEQRSHWRPAKHPPTNRKGKAIVRLLDAIARQDEVLRGFMTPQPLKAKA